MYYTWNIKIHQSKPRPNSAIKSTIDIPLQSTRSYIIIINTITINDYLVGIIVAIYILFLVDRIFRSVLCLHNTFHNSKKRYCGPLDVN